MNIQPSPLFLIPIFAMSVLFAGCLQSDKDVVQIRREAIAAHENQDWVKAIELYSTFLTKSRNDGASPSRAGIVLSRAFCALGAGEYTTAFEDASTVLGYAELYEGDKFFDSENEVSARIVIAAIHKQYGQFTRGKEQLDKALLINPNHAEANRLLKLFEDKISRADELGHTELNNIERRGQVFFKAEQQ